MLVTMRICARTRDWYDAHRSCIGHRQAQRRICKLRAIAKALDQPRAKQGNRGIAQALWLSNQIVPIAVVESYIEGPHQAARSDLFVE